MPARPFDGFREVLIAALVALTAGCSGPMREDILVPDLAPPSITISFPEGNAKFPVETSIPLRVVLKTPDGQGNPTLIPRIMKGKTIMADGPVGEPTTTIGDERMFLVDFKKGVPKAGKYEVFVEGIMTLPGKSPGQFPESERESRIRRFYSNTLSLEVTK